MYKKHIVKINTQGGIFVPKTLQEILHIAKSVGVEDINFGPRQEIFFNIPPLMYETFVEKMKSLEVFFEIDTDFYPNVVSSYPAAEVLTWDNWLSEGVYKDVFYRFDFQPRLKVNICDYNQSLTPLFTGNLNFVASTEKQYWYLFIQLPSSTALHLWNKRIYTTDIPKLIFEIEELYFNHRCTEPFQIEQIIQNNLTYLHIDIDEPFELQRYLFPYYEGMNRYGDKFWLGIYRRNYLFPVSFLLELTQLCIETHIAQLCITCWRSLLIKGITQRQRIRWESLLGKYNINLRHSANELNWMVNDINSEEIFIKHSIAQVLDQIDARTFGLTFGISLEKNAFVPTNIIIAKSDNPIHADEPSEALYNIYYRKYFNPNEPEIILFSQNVSLKNLAPHILEISALYYSQLQELEQAKEAKILQQPSPSPTIAASELYQCPNCLYIYDMSVGEPDKGIAPQTAFEQLPHTFCCPLCDTEIDKFNSITPDQLHAAGSLLGTHAMIK